MAKEFTAKISGSGKRAETWRYVFDTETVHIKSPALLTIDLPGQLQAWCYALDLAILDDGQRQRLVAHLSEKFDIPARQVDALLDSHGCPIRAEDVMVTVKNPQKWFG